MNLNNIKEQLKRLVLISSSNYVANNMKNIPLLILNIMY